MDQQERARRGEINIVFGEPQAGSRTAIRQALSREGYVRLREVNDFGDLQAVLKAAYPDIVIIDSMMLGPDPGEALRELRRGHLGRNPFVPIIITAWDPPEAVVRAVVDGGADGLIAKPLAPSILLERIQSLAHRRKPFVVTADYIGPDRRRDPNRRESLSIPTIDVPNPLGAKLRGEPMRVTDLEAAIRDTRHQVNEQRLNRNGFQVAFLVEQILPQLREGHATEETRHLLEKLHQVTKDTADRLVGTAFEHVGELCTAMRDVVETLQANMMAPPVKALLLLKRLGDALLLAFHPSADGAAMAEQIAAAVKRYQSRKGAA